MLRKRAQLSALPHSTSSIAADVAAGMSAPLAAAPGHSPVSTPASVSTVRLHAATAERRRLLTPGPSLLTELHGTGTAVSWKKLSEAGPPVVCRARNQHAILVVRWQEAGAVDVAGPQPRAKLTGLALAGKRQLATRAASRKHCLSLQVRQCARS